MADPWMTVGEAVAWIATRDDKILAAARDGSPIRLTLILASWATSTKRKLFRSHETALRILAERCSSGRIASQGKRGTAEGSTDFDHAAMPAYAWVDLAIAEAGREFVARPKRDQRGTWWHEVRVGRENVQRCFPPATLAELVEPKPLLVEPVPTALPASETAAERTIIGKFDRALNIVSPVTLAGYSATFQIAAPPPETAAQPGDEPEPEPAPAPDPRRRPGRPSHRDRLLEIVLLRDRSGEALPIISDEVDIIRKLFRRQNPNADSLPASATVRRVVSRFRILERSALAKSPDQN